MKDRVLVIIVSYNFTPWIDRCLGSLRLAEGDIDVMVVDNASTDDTVGVVKRDYPEVMLVENRQNLGFGQANNIGLRYAVDHGYDFVFLLNQDAWVDSRTIITLAEKSHSHCDFGILSPIHMNGEGDKMDFGFSAYIGVSDINQLPEGEVVEKQFINAAFWLIPVEVLKRVGGFSPLFFHYGEDVDFVNRIHYHNYKVGYSRVRGYHDREKRETPRQKQMRLDMVYQLIVATNINYRPMNSFVNSIGGGSKFALTALMSGKMREAGYYMGTTLKLLANTWRIKRARRQTKRKEPSFL